jgi:hypothetical protein
MLSVDDIASMWQVSREYARDVLVKQEGFPAPAPGSTRKFQRWRQTDVLRFAGLAEGEGSAGIPQNSRNISR